MTALPMRWFTKALVACSCALLAGSAVAAPSEASRVRDVVLVPVTLNGTGPYPFILDTASPMSVVDPGVARYLRLERQEIPGESGNVTIVPSARAEAGGGSEEGPLAVADLSGFEARIGQRVAGVLGQNLMPPVFELDLQAGTFEALPDGGEAGNGGWYGIPLDWEDGVPQVSVVVDGGQSVTCIVDTAFGPALGLPPSRADAFGLLDESRPRIATQPGPGGAPEDFAVRIGRLHVGAAEVRGPLGLVDNTLDAPLLGLGFLERFRIRLNRAEGELALQPIGDHPVELPAPRGFGITLAQRAQGYWWIQVAENSPAAREGLMTGDVLRQVEGESLEGLNHREATEILENAGEAAAVTVLRNGQPFSVALEAEPLL